MLTAWSVRERILAAAVLLFAVLLLADGRRGLVPEAHAQSEQAVQDILSSPPDFRPFHIWGDGQTRVFASDGYGIYRSEKNGAPGTWQLVLR